MHKNLSGKQEKGMMKKKQKIPARLEEISDRMHPLAVLFRFSKKWNNKSHQSHTSMKKTNQTYLESTQA